MQLEDAIIAINEQENRRFAIGEMFKRMKQYDLIAQRIEGRRIWTSPSHTEPERFWGVRVVHRSSHGRHQREG